MSTERLPGRRVLRGIGAAALLVAAPVLGACAERRSSSTEGTADAAGARPVPPGACAPSADASAFTTLLESPVDPTTPGEPRLDVAFMLATGPSAVPPDPAELDAEVGALLRHARRGLPDRAITVVTVDRIEAYAAGELTVAGALAFTPTLYHHPDDFPARNGVLVGSVYRRCGAVPGRPSPRAVAHELGHMALDVNHHEEDTDNLMSRMLGRELTAEQCERMRQRIALLYGDAPLADPGPPRPG